MYLACACWILLNIYVYECESDLCVEVDWLCVQRVAVLQRKFTSKNFSCQQFFGCAWGVHPFFLVKKQALKFGRRPTTKQSLENNKKVFWSKMLTWISKCEFQTHFILCSYFCLKFCLVFGFHCRYLLMATGCYIKYKS